MIIQSNSIEKTLHEYASFKKKKKKKKKIEKNSEINMQIDDKTTILMKINKN